MGRLIWLYLYVIGVGERDSCDMDGVFRDS